MRVLIPSLLRSYTGGRSEVEASGSTLTAVLSELDSAYPGFRFRIIDEQDQVRGHIRIFVNVEVQDGIEMPLEIGDEVHMICALSGGRIRIPLGRSFGRPMPSRQGATVGTTGGARHHPLAISMARMNDDRPILGNGESFAPSPI